MIIALIAYFSSFVLCVVLLLKRIEVIIRKENERLFKDMNEIELKKDLENER
jgi:hypothetical protein